MEMGGCVVGSVRGWLVSSVWSVVVRITALEGIFDHEEGGSGWKGRGGFKGVEEERGVREWGYAAYVVTRGVYLISFGLMSLHSGSWCFQSADETAIFLSVQWMDGRKDGIRWQDIGIYETNSVFLLSLAPIARVLNDVMKCHFFALITRCTMHDTGHWTLEYLG